MNKGIELASGAYILILNSDDYYCNNCVEILLSALLFENVDFVSGLAYEIDENDNVIRKIPLVPFSDNVMIRMPLRHETMMISKAMYNKVGLYDVTYRIIADLKLTQMFYKSNFKHHEVDSSVLYFRKNGVSRPLNNALFFERKRLLKENFSFLEDSDCTIIAMNEAKTLIMASNIVTKYASYEFFTNSILDFLNI